MNEEITIQQILDALSEGDEQHKKKIKFLFFNVGAMRQGINLIHFAMNHGLDQLREAGIKMPE